MSHTFSNLLVHLIWSTKDREPFIKKELKSRIHSYLRTVTEEKGVKLLFCNGIEDHVHLLVAMPLTLTVPDLIEKIKPVSTKWIRKTFPELSNFSWQEGYGAFSVGKSNLQMVINYIKNQEEHHKKFTFKEEFTKFLELQGIPYDKDLIFK